jgi:RNA polymerase sigma-70 factor (ECF subfamily)
VRLRGPRDLRDVAVPHQIQRVSEPKFAALPQGYDAATVAPDDAHSAPRADLRRDLEGAVAELPERYRGVVVLYYLQDLSYPEIAEILELPLGTVKTHLHRAKRLLRTKLQGWDPGWDRGEDDEAVEAAP